MLSAAKEDLREKGKTRYRRLIILKHWTNGYYKSFLLRFSNLITPVKTPEVHSLCQYGQKNHLSLAKSDKCKNSPGGGRTHDLCIFNIDVARNSRRRNGKS